MGIRLTGASALKPAGFVFAPVGLLVAFNGFASGLYWLVFFGVMMSVLGVWMIILAYRPGKTQADFFGVWMPGFLFFIVGTTFLWAGLADMGGHAEQGRVVILGSIASAIGFFVLTSAAYLRIRYRHDPERGELKLGRILAVMGLGIAGLVLLFVYVLGFALMIMRPEDPVPGLALVAVPTVFLLIFGTIYYFVRR